jgi:hypothetical protein
MVTVDALEELVGGAGRGPVDGEDLLLLLQQEPLQFVLK